MDIEVGEVVEVSLLMPTYSMVDRGPEEVTDFAAKRNSWFRGRVCRIMGDRNEFIWVDFGRKLTKEVLWGYDHLESHYNTYNGIYHVNVVRRLNSLERLAAEI